MFLNSSHFWFFNFGQHPLLKIKSCWKWKKKLFGVFSFSWNMMSKNWSLLLDNFIKHKLLISVEYIIPKSTYMKIKTFFRNHSCGNGCMMMICDTENLWNALDILMWSHFWYNQDEISFMVDKKQMAKIISNFDVACIATFKNFKHSLLS